MLSVKKNFSWDYYRVISIIGCKTNNNGYTVNFKCTVVCIRQYSGLGSVLESDIVFDSQKMIEQQTNDKHLFQETKFIQNQVQDILK